MTSSTPRIIGGRYVLGEGFRQGGMARVYRGFDPQTSTAVAVKILTRQLNPDERYRNLEFDRESRALQRLDHPNIVRMLGGGRDEDSGEPFLVFDWLENDLEAALVHRPVEGWDDFATAYAQPILEGIAHAHEQHILHRDVKPSNVLIGPGGIPQVTDFGIAKLKTDFRPGLTLADFQTRPYAPPEFDDGEFSYTRDVHAFGVLCLVALTGVDPFGELYRTAPYAAITDALALLDVPAEIDDLLRSCVSTDPEERPRDAAVAITRLRLIDQRRNVSQRPSQTFYLDLTPRMWEQLQLHTECSSRADATAVLESDLEEDAAVDCFFDASTGEPMSGQFRIFGSELRLFASVHRDTEDRLFVTGVTRLPGSLLEKLRDGAHRQPMQFRVGSPPNRTEARAQLLDLQVSVAEHVAERRATEREEESRRLLRVWKSILDAKGDIERQREAPVRYRQHRGQGRRVLFELEQDAGDELLGQPRQVELEHGGFLGGEIYEVSGDTVAMAVRYGDPDRIPSKGTLRFDTSPARVALRRQSTALEALTYRRSLRPDLGDLLLHPERAALPSPVELTSFVQGDLDAPKRAAVSAALGTQDMLLVQGPPGTGKTTFITELVLQELKHNPESRILITSQTHAALDNVLERLAELDDSLRLVRIARPGDPRVSAAVDSYLIDHQLDRWGKEVVAQGRRRLRDWAKEKGISDRGVEIATLYEEMAAATIQEAGLRADLATANQELDAASHTEGDTAVQQGSALEEEVARLEDALESLERDNHAAIGRLVQIRAITKRSEANGLAVDDLRARAAEAVDRAHPAFDECQRLLQLLGGWHARFGSGDEFYAATLIRSQVVAATCLGLQSYPGAESVEFDLCVVDEASKATVTETIVPMTQAKRWVLVGDARQLPPFVEEALLHPQILKEHDLDESDLRRTLFDHLTEALPMAAQTVLTSQYRMVPQIGNLISECFYDGQLKSAPRGRPDWLALALPTPVTWYTTSTDANRFEVARGTSRANPLEARLARALLQRLDSHAKLGAERLDVAVLTGYTAQRQQIEREISAHASHWAHLTVEVATVDAFQGRETDVLIYSVTRSNPENQIGFLREQRRLNVALSRGRLALVLLGDHLCARAGDDEENPFVRVADYIQMNPNDCIIEVADQ
jgi:hypothetical protein